MDKRFAAELITAKGKIYKFDSAECMAGYLAENPALASNDRTMLLVTDYDHPGTFEDACKSVFLRDATILSPMGGNLAVFDSETAAKGFQKDAHAKILSWKELLELNK